MALVTGQRKKGVINIKQQKIKIEYNNNELFFFDHSLKTALEHADDFIKRNNEKEIKLFVLNTSNFGPKWTPAGIYNKKERC